MVAWFCAARSAAGFGARLDIVGVIRGLDGLREE